MWWVGQREKVVPSTIVHAPEASIRNYVRFLLTKTIKPHRGKIRKNLQKIIRSRSVFLD